MDIVVIGFLLILLIGYAISQRFKSRKRESEIGFVYMKIYESFAYEVPYKKFFNLVSSGDTLRNLNEFIFIDNTTGGIHYDIVSMLVDEYGYSSPVSKSDVDKMMVCMDLRLNAEIGRYVTDLKSVYANSLNLIIMDSKCIK